MHRRSFSLCIILLVLNLHMLLVSADTSDKKKIETVIPILPNNINGIAANEPSQQVSPITTDLSDNEIYREYGVKELTLRRYGRFQVEVFTTEYPAQAYGLYSFYRDPLATATEFGTEGDLDVVERVVRFWQGTRFVRLQDKASTDVGIAGEQIIKLAAALAEHLNNIDTKNSLPEDIASAKKLPSVVAHLPAGSLHLRTAQYVLGPQALARLIARDASMYQFYPDFGTEIALANYNQGNNQMRLMVIEYHTPQQASEALTKLNQYRESLPPEQQAKLLIKRRGNFVVEASNFGEITLAQQTVDTIKYDYVVKWLTETPANNGRDFVSEANKTAKVLVSVFGIVGAMMVFGLVAGTGFGFAKFYLRRRQARHQLNPFTDAGGMVQLNLEGIALPESRQNHKLLGNGS